MLFQIYWEVKRFAKIFINNTIFIFLDKTLYELCLRLFDSHVYFIKPVKLMCGIRLLTGHTIFIY